MDTEARQTADRLAAILESAVDGIVTIDAKGMIDSVNQAAIEIFGFSRDELVGRSVNQLMPSPACDEHDAYIENYLKTRKAKVIGIGREVLGCRKGGMEVPLYLAVSEGRHNGEVLFTGILRDLTDLHVAEERARAAEQLASLSLITAGIAHDIGTPMNVILGYADMLRDSLSDPKDRRRAEVISEQVRRVTDLLQTLLNIARPQKPVSVSVRVAEVLDHALEFFREKLRSRQIVVDRRYEGDPEVLGDRDRLEQMFLNLIVNAADAMPKGGRLTVSVESTSKDGIHISIEDTGYGIEPEALGRIFEPFYTSKDRGEGTGLGLVVSRSIVLDHRGTIEVESEVRKGTRFTLHFPAFERASRTA
ncbi:MAG: PAS domain S-box protein [bacterium]|nr:PAS domain S-box protein [bacterium]